jgi:hypothetical protein
MKQRIIFIAAFVLGTLLTAAPPAWAQPDIDVSPLAVDFGEVEIGLTVSTIVTVTSVGHDILTVFDFLMSPVSDPAFLVADAPDAPVFLWPIDLDPSKATADVVLTFTPTAPGQVFGEFEVYSDDPDDPLVIVGLSGTGVVSGDVTPQDLINFFNDQVTFGNITGNANTGKGQQKKVTIVNRHLEKVGLLLDKAAYYYSLGRVRAGDGKIKASRKRVRKLVWKTDGELRPKDYVVGSAVAEFQDMLIECWGVLSCDAFLLLYK